MKQVRSKKTRSMVTTVGMFPLYRLCGAVFVVCFLLSYLAMTGEALMCYQCKDALTNEECNTPDNLVDCAEVDKYEYARPDTCKATVFKMPGQDIRYTKGCVVGPCSLAGDQNVALGMTNCDRGSNEWECQYCCKSEKCNTSGAISGHAMFSITTCYVAVVALAMIM